MSEVTIKKRQPSRKGKKAWRKNVDIEDIEQDLQDKRDEQIIKGVHDIDEDFIIDDLPSTTKSTNVPKKLKAKEILSNKSKVPALINNRVKKNKNDTIQGVKKTEMLRLLSLRGGKYKDESISMNRAEKDGLINGDDEDLWDDNDNDEPTLKKAKIPKYNKSTAEVTKATSIPKTLKTNPIQISKNDLTDKFIHAGKSYNPSLESWKDLINKEYGIEYKRELNRQAMEEHKERIQELIAQVNDNAFSDSEDEEEKVEDEIPSEEKDYSLSINKPTKVKIKTKTKRNKELKHKERIKIEQEIKDLKKQLKDLNNLENILKSQEEEESKTNTKSSTKERSSKRNKLFKYTPIETPIEIKLSNELTNNLKNLKSEGNLFYDQMLNLQSSGKIESRIPINRKRKYAKKVTEKWTHKDFK
ncbi:uncharacterized protein KGF55_005668 [Candida pseudojiufengensis]|uniref:uncharacterized protein n=1 Tax=Candida pseudojiufengensis TaxID=497109 RepID=UPI0022247A2C|nr:uncharacterized protein KGF55_005668 [Candida pseudojiufengensis]KAI5959014.1 hypothetical protein KGF55_005668 [Candida pseudojiufengensis]